MQGWRSLLLVALAFVVPVTAHSAVITYSTADNATLDGLPVAASATFTTTNGGFTLLLENLLSDTMSVSQNISGIQFRVTDAMTGSLTSSAGTPRTIASKGTFVDAPQGSTDWLFSFGAGAFSLTALGASGPDQTIVGAPGGTNTYSDANGSIAGNDPHNPFLALQATFQFAALAMTGQSDISDVILFFGTGPAALSAVCSDGCPPGASAVPEPTSLLLFGSGLLGLVYAHRWSRARASTRGGNARPS